MDILICGYGNIGKKTLKELEGLYELGHNIYIYDINNPYTYDNLERHYDFAFICVSTDMLPDGKCDTSNVYDCVEKVDADIIIIKSTVPPLTTADIQLKYPNKKIVFSPEFYGTTIHAPTNLNFLILGGNIEDCSKVANLFHLIKPASFRIRFTDYETAELVKYMENCFLGLKVTFCAEFYKTARYLGIDYNDLRECFVLDERLGESHTYINPDQPYYDSHCLNKDIPAFVKFCEDRAFPAPLMNTVNCINKNEKEIYKKINE